MTILSVASSLIVYITTETDMAQVRSRSADGSFYSNKIKSKRGLNFEKKRKLDHSISYPMHDHHYVNDVDVDENIFLNDLDIAGNVDINSSQHASNDTWKSGRRIVEFQALAENMFCCQCRSPLHLKNTIGETQLGQGSILYIKCGESLCQTVTDVPTGKVNSYGSFDITDKVVIGMIHTGLGYSQVSNFLAECNIPVLSKATLHRHEKKMGAVIQQEAKESCDAAKTLEKNLTEDKDIEVSFDGGWQKRGTGFNYNSLTGHASIMGCKSGKVLCFDVRSKCCKLCELYKGKNETVPLHDCSHNWNGSSKSMEPDMAVSMVHTLEKECPVNVLHADNDSTTTMKIKLDFPYLQHYVTVTNIQKKIQNMKKKDDQNHLKKGMTKALLELSKRHKELNGDVSAYIAKSMMYAITSNRKDSEKLKSALQKIVPHIFGDHKLCVDTDWCKYKDNPSVFRYKSLPGGERLKSKTLKSDLEDFVQKYADRSSQLTELGSTQRNENFNQMVATKAPKSRHYGSSKSLTNRVAASVLQKNEGFSYLEKVNESAALSPGVYTHKIATRLDKIREKRRKKQQTIDFKRRRVQLKKERKTVDRCSTVHESVSYQSGLEMSVNEEEKQHIPVPYKIKGNESYVIFDIETTGLSRASDLTQIAAKCGEKEFQTYVLPRCSISVEASRVTGITFSLATNKLYVHGQEVQADTQSSALLDFTEFLMSIANPILVGHNAANFDMGVLTTRLLEFNLFSSFCDVAPYFLDSLKIARQIFPKNQVGNYKQSTLVQKVLRKEYNAHCAIEDVRALKELFDKMCEHINHQDIYSTKYCVCKCSYNSLLQSKSVSREVVQKLSKGGISLGLLRLANKRDPKGAALVLHENKVSSKWLSVLNKAFETES